MAAAALLIWRRDGLRPENGDQFERVAGAFPSTVRGMQAQDLRRDRSLLRTWSHPAAFAVGPVTDGAGGWLTVTGNPSRTGLGEGQAALTRLLAECSANVDRTLATLSPPYALLFGNRTELTVAVDRCGLQHLYVREQRDGSVWIASSALALATLGATFDPDAAAEWLAAGHFVSERTFAREIRKIGPGEVLRLARDGCRARPGPASEVARRTGDDRYRAALLAAIGAADRDRGLAAELTGGLDSRLLHAGRQAAGVDATAWTIGEPESADLRTVARLRRTAAFPHVAVAVDGGAAQLAQRAVEMHELSDGEVNALEYAPLLFAFDRLRPEVQVSLSGAGGEIGRAYYHAAIKPDSSGIDVDKLVRKLSGATRPAVHSLSRERFSEPLEPLRRAVVGALARSAGPPDVRLDDFYIRARMQRFGGRNTSTTGLFWRQALPFFDNEVVDATLALPRERKRQSAAVRAAIADWAPAFARVPLDSGIAVAPLSWRAPGTMLRWSAAMGRKAATRYGGRPARRLVRPPADATPWEAVRASTGFRDLIGDTLLAPSGARVDELMEPLRVRALARDALAGGPLYPIGLVLTLELTLRRFAGA
jgi:asparagine synthetase B (glutamine-hydrolysing)